MKSYTKYILLFISVVLVAGCGSTSAVGGAEMSRGDKDSRIGVSNTGEGTEMYGSIRMGGSFK